MDRTRIGIIGTAGRKEDFNKLSRRLFVKMKDKAWDYITTQLLLKESDICLISGGAAWADHVAVTMYLETYKDSTLHLYLPAQFDLNEVRFKETKGTTIMENKYESGRIANYYHNLFSESAGLKSLRDIARAIEYGADITIDKGFKERNTLIANDVDFLIAFTFGDGPEPKDGGGTYDTWQKCSAPKIHFPIHLL